MGPKYKTAPLNPHIEPKRPKIIKNLIFYVFYPKCANIWTKIYRILICPFCAIFGLKRRFDHFCNGFFSGNMKIQNLHKKIIKNKYTCNFFGNIVQVQTKNIYGLILQNICSFEWSGAFGAS